MHRMNGKRSRGEGERETAVLNQILLCNGSTLVCQFPEHLSSAALPPPALLFSSLLFAPRTRPLPSLSPVTYMHMNTPLQPNTQCAARRGGSRDDARWSNL